jgi:hypothetical protein
MKQTKTFDAITRLLDDGSWHALEDLRAVTSWPDEWVRELAAEGVIDTKDQVGDVLVRLRNPRRIGTSA